MPHRSNGFPAKNPAPARMIAVLLIAAPGVFRLGLAHAIRGFAHMRLVGTVDSLDLADQGVAALAPDVIVLLQHLGAELPQIWAQASNVVRLTALGGATSEVSTDLPADLTIPMLEDAIMQAAAQIPRTVTDAHPYPVDQHARKLTLPQGRPRFGTQQRRVLALITKGMTNPEIASIMGMSLPTARYHVSAILNKLGVSNRTEASAVAVAQHLIDAQDYNA